MKKKELNECYDHNNFCKYLKLNINNWCPDGNKLKYLESNAKQIRKHYCNTKCSLSDICDLQYKLYGCDNMKNILCIVGESGSGKTISADYINNKYKIPILESYTDRPKRRPSETGHKFILAEHYDKLEPEEMLIPTIYGNYRYAYLKSDIRDNNILIADESGLMGLLINHRNDYNVKSLRLYRDYDDRINSIGYDRVNRDVGKFNLESNFFDYIILNDDYDSLYTDLDRVVEDFFKNE